MSDADLLECCRHVDCGQICTCCLECCSNSCYGVNVTCSCLAIAIMLVAIGLCLNFIISYYFTVNQDIQTVDCRLCGEEYFAINLLKCCQIPSVTNCTKKNYCVQTFKKEPQIWLTVCIIMVGFSFLGMFLFMIIGYLDRTQRSLKRNQERQRMAPLIELIQHKQGSFNRKQLCLKDEMRFKQMKGKQGRAKGREH